MITRGIVVDIKDNGNKLKVRLPIIDGFEGVSGSTEDEALSWASSVCFSGIRVNYEKGDVVVVGFEDNNIGIPIVLGHLNLVNKEMPSKVTGNFTDLESNALSVNCRVPGLGDNISLLNANSDGLSVGGINYLSLTNSESCTVLYDRRSSVAGLNWGLPGGILGGKIVTNKDFSSYSYLRITAFTYDINFVYLINLSTNDYKSDTSTYMAQPITNYRYGGSGTIVRPSEQDDAETYYSTSLVSTDKKSFYHYQSGYTENNIYNIRNDNSLYYISKIEGIKQN